MDIIICLYNNPKRHICSLISMTIYLACFQYIQLKYKLFKGYVLGNLINHPENVFIDYIMIK